MNKIFMIIALTFLLLMGSVVADQKVFTNVNHTGNDIYNVGLVNASGFYDDGVLLTNSGGGGNASFNESHTDGLYIALSSESDLNVNQSAIWIAFNNFNSTQIQNNGGIFNIIPSWLTAFINNIVVGVYETVTNVATINNTLNTVSTKLDNTNTTDNIKNLGFLKDSGDTSTGSINMGGNDIYNALNVNATNFSGSGQVLTLETLGSASFSTIQEIQNLFHSSGVFNSNISVSFVTLNGGNTFNVSGGSGTIRATINATDTLFFFDWSASNNIAVSLDETIYVGIEYNAGSPQVVTKSTNTWNSQTEFPLGSVVRDDSGIHLQREDHNVGDHATNMIERLFETSPFARDNRGGGLIIGTSGHNITVTAGTIWEKLNKFPISAVDTSGATTFDRYYRNESTGWFIQQDVSQWNFTHYDDGTGTLNALANNKFSVEWVYLEVDGEIVTVFGQEQFNSLGEASASSPPSTLPDRLQVHARLIGRILFQQAAASASATESVFTTTFSVSGVTDHGNLAGLSDNDHPQYELQLDNSAGLLAALSDETGTGLAMFSFQPHFTGTTTVFTFGEADLSETELEILDGATLTTTEINYVDGVTSAIQTQLSALLSLAGGVMTGNIDMGQGSLFNAFEVNSTWGVFPIIEQRYGTGNWFGINTYSSDNQLILTFEQTASAGAGKLKVYDASQGVAVTLDGSNGAITATGALAGTTLNTGQGANELYAMSQDVESSDAVSFITLDTGQGANELYDMNQNVLITSDVIFHNLTLTGNSTIAGNHIIYWNGTCRIEKVGNTQDVLCP